MGNIQKSMGNMIPSIFNRFKRPRKRELEEISEESKIASNAHSEVFSDNQATSPSKRPRREHIVDALQQIGATYGSDSEQLDQREEVSMDDKLEEASQASLASTVIYESESADAPLLSPSSSCPDFDLLLSSPSAPASSHPLFANPAVAANIVSFLPNYLSLRFVSKEFNIGVTEAAQIPVHRIPFSPPSSRSWSAPSATCKLSEFVERRRRLFWMPRWIILPDQNRPHPPLSSICARLSVHSSFAHITSLIFRTPITDSGLYALCAYSRSHFSHLTTLYIHNGGVTDHGMSYFPSASFPCLTELNLGSNKITSQGLQHLSSSDIPLKRLHVFNNKIKEDGVAALTAETSRIAPTLEMLDLSNNPLGDAAIIHITRSTSMMNLTSLYLARCGFGTKACTAFALPTTENMDRLRHLDVSANKCGFAGGAALLLSPKLKKLMYLDMRGCEVPEDKANEYLRKRGRSQLAFYF